MYFLSYFPFFFFNDTATTEIYTLSLHDALPIYGGGGEQSESRCTSIPSAVARDRRSTRNARHDLRPHRHVDFRSEEHTSELQSQSNLVCRLLLEKKNTKHHYHN